MFHFYSMSQKGLAFVLKEPTSRLLSIQKSGACDMYISSNLTISTHPRYAGGLGPQNLTKQIHKMKAAAPDR